MKIELTVEELKEIVGGWLLYDVTDEKAAQDIKIDGGGIVIKDFKEVEGLIPIP